MTKQDIIDYVTTTPHNTNRAVLNSMLDIVIQSESEDSEESTNIIMPAQYIVVTDSAVEVQDVDMSTLTNGEKLLYRVLIVDTETQTFTIHYGDGEAHTTIDEMIGVVKEEPLYITVKKIDDLWTVRVTDGSSIVAVNYVVEVLKSDVLSIAAVIPREE